MRLKTIYNTLVIATILILSSCSYVHEWPEVSSKVPFYIHLTYDTEMTLWEHTFDGTDLQETSKNTIVNNTRDYGKIRYIIRAYPISQSKSSLLFAFANIYDSFNCLNLSIYGLRNVLYNTSNICKSFSEGK